MKKILLILLLFIGTVYGQPNEYTLRQNVYYEVLDNTYLVITKLYIAGKEDLNNYQLSMLVYSSKRKCTVKELPFVIIEINKELEIFYRQ